MVAGCPNGVPLAVGQLALDGIEIPPLFIEERRGNVAETVGRHLLRAIRRPLFNLRNIVRATEMNRRGVKVVGEVN